MCGALGNGDSGAVIEAELVGSDNDGDNSGGDGHASGVHGETRSADAGDTGIIDGYDGLPEHEEVPVKCGVSPVKPNAAEISAHGARGHLPHRSWCRICMQARMKKAIHASRERVPPAVPHISADYCFLTTEGEDGHLTCMVMKCHTTRMMFAHIVMAKGRQFPDSVAELIRDIRRLGYSRVVMRTDRENPVKAVVSAVKDSGQIEVIPELSGADEHAQNGMAENGVQQVENQIRAIKLSVEENLQIKINLGHPLMPWIVEHAPDCLNKFVIGDDGLSAYERLKGKKAGDMHVEMAEKVLYTPSRKGAPKLDERSRPGIWLGKRFESVEHVLADCETMGIVYSSRVARLPVEERWDALSVVRISASPWDKKARTSRRCGLEAVQPGCHGGGSWSCYPPAILHNAT